jgi:hypothetical protein
MDTGSLLHIAMSVTGSSVVDGTYMFTRLDLVATGWAKGTMYAAGCAGCPALLTIPLSVTTGLANGVYVGVYSERGASVSISVSRMMSGVYALGYLFFPLLCDYDVRL